MGSFIARILRYRTDQLATQNDNNPLHHPPKTALNLLPKIYVKRMTNHPSPYPPMHYILHSIQPYNAWKKIHFPW